MKERPTGQGGKKMAKYFELQQTNGNSTFVVLVADPIVESGSIRATIVGTVNGFSDFLEHNFTKCEPTDIIAIGNVICREVKNPFAE